MSQNKKESSIIHVHYMTVAKVSFRINDNGSATYTLARVGVKGAWMSFNACLQGQ